MTYNQKISKEVLKIADYVNREEMGAEDALSLICDLAEDVYFEATEPCFDEPDEEPSTLILALCNHFENYHSEKSYLRDLDEGEELDELRRWVRLALKG